MSLCARIIWRAGHRFMVKHDIKKTSPRMDSFFYIARTCFLLWTSLYIRSPYFFPLSLIGTSHHLQI